MSADSIARWNAIPMEGPSVGPAAANSLKRARDHNQDGESDDDVSLVSRSPSPPANDAMDIDKYDEYVHRPEREVITVDTRISSTNKGFAMLAKLGWVEGTPLGLSGDGRVDPVPFILKNDMTGLGKHTQDVRMIETTVAQRRELDSERQIKETEEQRRARQATVAKRAAVKSEISNVLKAFYCDLCEKQFQNVAQYDEHTNSYAHHHKARFRDMQAAQKASFSGSMEERKEKERKREEKELRKIAKAAGIKLTKPGGPSSAGVSAGAPMSATASGQKSSGFRKPGWATVGGPPSPPPPVLAAPSSTTSWSTVGNSSTAGHSSSGSGWASVSQPSVAPPPPPQTPEKSNAPPAFRTGGWTSLDTGSSMPPAPLPQALAHTAPAVGTAPPPPPASFPAPVPAPVAATPMASAAARGGWAPVLSGPAPSSGSRGGWTAVPAAASQAPPSAPKPSGPPQSQAPRAERQEASRSGWQQFKTGGRRR